MNFLMHFLYLITQLEQAILSQQHINGANTLCT